MRRIDERALQQTRRITARPFAAAFGLLLLGACANEGIWPTEPLPPAPEGPPPPTPSFLSPTSGNLDPDVLTELERKELEERLARIAKERERGVVRAIQKGK